jgi:hypothetical protein
MIRFSILNGLWAIVRLGSDEPTPQWAALARPFSSLTRTSDELSIVAPESCVPSGVASESDWVVIKLHGPFPFTQIGVLSSVASPLAQAGIGIFAVSTFDTDYVLVKAGDAVSAREVLVAAGHELVVEPPG